jgi:hypothetical protein
MIGALRFSAASIFVCFALTSPAAALCVSPKGLSGTWTANDGGSYYVRRLGNVVWWVGESADDGVAWTNAFRGTTDGKTITGEWVDVIQATGHFGVGTLTLKINGVLGTGVHGFDKIGGTGSGFGGVHWFMPCHDTN